MDFKSLFWEVFNCDGEEELHKLVNKNEAFKNSDNWYPYGGKHENDRSNFSTFQNQQPSAEGALIEKITNSIDALLLKHCKKEDVDPKSAEAPSSIEKAVEKFFKIPKGDISELQSGERTNLAKENIQILATGNEKDPDILVYDNGEGQHPSEFKDTFLSIANNNKTDIKFVQGKFNMGSTGAVVFCGEYAYQLIASKMDKNLFSKNNDKYSENSFGWTLVRKHILSETEEEGYRSSWYEYFAIEGKTIPSFPIDFLDIGLYDDKIFETGSFIKLYSYKLSRGANSAVSDPSNGLYKELNQLLYKPALPLWLYDKRTKYASQHNSVAMYGNHVRFNNQISSKNSILEIHPIYEKLGSRDIGELTITVIILKKGEDRQQQTNYKRNYIGSKRSVIFTLNGQVQGREGRSIITQDLGLNFLKDSMLIVVDCSRLRSSFRQDIFMANRSHVRESEKYSILRSKVIEALKEKHTNSILRKINDERKNAIIHGGDDDSQKELIQSILSRVPLDESLTQLLKKGIDPINLPSRQTHAESSEGDKIDIPKETKRFPSIFKIDAKKDAKGKQFKSIPLNGKGHISFETDVDSDYFYRPYDSGDLHLYILGAEPNESEGGDNAGKPKKIEDVFEIIRSNPRDGSIKLILKPNNEELNVGDEIDVCAKLTSPEGDLESIFYVKIVDPAKPQKSQSQKEPDKPSLPKLIKISHINNDWQHEDGETWNESDWGFDTVINIISSGPDSEKFLDAIVINMSSNCLKRYLRKSHSKNEAALNILKNKYITNVYLHGLFLYSIFERQRLRQKVESNDEENGAEIEDAAQFIDSIFKQYGDVLVNLDTNKEVLESYEDSDD